MRREDESWRGFFDEARIEIPYSDIDDLAHY